MNLEEEGDKDGAEREVLEEGLDDFGDIDYLSGELFGEEKTVSESRSRRAKSRSRANFAWGIERVYFVR